MKKVLSMLLIFAMILTMASFPAFAGEAITLSIADATQNYGSSCTPDKAIDGDTSTYFRGNTYHAPGEGIKASNSVYMVFELPEKSTLESYHLQWGIEGKWGVTGPDSYRISVSEDGEEYTELRYFEGLYSADSLTTYAGVVIARKGGGTSSYNYSITEETGLNVENVKFIKIQPLSWCERPCLVEFSITGTPTPSSEPEVPTPDFKEDSIETLGAGIRLADDDLTAGIRFGATVSKADAAIEGNYVYSDDANVKFGMYLLPAEKVDVAGGETLKDLVEAGNEDVLDVVAKKIYAQDEETLTYTAVLTDIPEGAYNKNIIALPYVKVDDDVIYYETDANSYAGVAQAAFDANEAGTVTLTEVQVKALKEILGLPIETTYTVNYVDAEGNPVADAKNGTGNVGDEVTENAVEVEGYTADKASETITLIDGENTITFTYTEVPETYVLTFDANGGTGEMTALTGDTAYTLPECTFTAPEGKKFAGWNVFGYTQAPGTEVVLTSDRVCSAVWEDVSTEPEGERKLTWDDIDSVSLQDGNLDASIAGLTGNRESLFDGNTASEKGNGVVYAYFPATKVHAITINFKEVTDLSKMVIHWGNSAADGTCQPAKKVEIYVGTRGAANADQEKVYTYEESTAPDGMMRTDTIDFSTLDIATEDICLIRIRVVETAYESNGRLAVREIEIYEN